MKKDFYIANITTAVFAGILVTTLFYATNLYSLVSRTVAVKQVEKETATLSSSLSTLDAEYLRLSSAITPDAMTKHGLSQAQVSVYITRPAATASAASVINLARGGHEL